MDMLKTRWLILEKDPGQGVPKSLIMSEVATELVIGLKGSPNENSFVFVYMS